MLLASQTTNVSFALPATTVKEVLFRQQPAHQELSDLSWVEVLLAPNLTQFQWLAAVQALATNVCLDTTAQQRQLLFLNCAQLVTSARKVRTSLNNAQLASTARLVRLIKYHAHLDTTVSDSLTFT